MGRGSNVQPAARADGGAAAGDPAGDRGGQPAAQGARHLHHLAEGHRAGAVRRVLRARSTMDAENNLLSKAAAGFAVSQSLVYVLAWCGRRLLVVISGSRTTAVHASFGQSSLASCKTVAALCSMLT